MIVSLRVLHIAFAAAWFGHKLLVPGDIRKSVHAGPAEWEMFLPRLRRAERFGIVTGLGTLASGGALLWAVGIDSVGYGVWTGLALVVGAIAMGAVVARPASKRLRDAIGRGDRVEATVAGGQISRTLGIESLLWLGALTAMVI